MIASLRAARQTPLAILLVVLALAAAACSSNPARGDTITITAEFPDVIDLVVNAHVRAGDVPIGAVTKIELTDDELARVTMVIEQDSGLPENAQAVLARTSLLGERYIDLRPPQDATATGALADGQAITDVRMVTDFEDLVVSGADVLAEVSAQQLAAAVETGAVAFGGREDILAAFLDDVSGFVGRYRSSTDDLLDLIDALDRFSAAYAPDASANAATLEDLRLAAEAFSQEDDQLLDTLEDVTRLSVAGKRVLDRNADEMTNLIRRLRKFLQEFTRIDGVLQDVLTWFPRHNIHVPNGAIDEKAQTWLDFIICGADDTAGDTSRDCEAPNRGRGSVDPGFYPWDEPCWDDLAACPANPRNDPYQEGAQ